MKSLYTFLLFFLAATSLFSQDFIRNSTIHLRDSSVVKGDFYYYPTLAKSVILVDRLGAKQKYDLATIETIEGVSVLYRVFDLKGDPVIFEAIIEGAKANLYKINDSKNIQYYVFKDNRLLLLEGGIIAFVKGDNNYIKENNKYKGTLKYLLSDNNYVVDKIDKLKYDEHSLASVVIAYNDGHISYLKEKAIEKQSKPNLYRIINHNGKPEAFEAITEGEKVSLYKTNDNKSVQFYLLKDDTLTILEGGEIEFEKDGNKYRKENTRYKGTLKFLLNDNTYVVDKIDKITYDESSIAPLIIAYNGGYTSYLKDNVIEKQNGTPNLKIFSQYSHGGNIGTISFANGYGANFIQAGIEYFRSEGSRHSFKFGFEYGKYDAFDVDLRPGLGSTSYQKIQHLESGAILNISTCYYYDILRKPNSNVYFGAELLNIYLLYDVEEDILPRFSFLSPLLGYEHHITKKTDIYVELNHLLNFGSIPLNFSLGISYDL